MISVLVFDTYRSEPWLVGWLDRINSDVIRTCLGKTFEFRSYQVIAKAEAVERATDELPVMYFSGQWDEVCSAQRGTLYFTLKIDRREIHNKLAAIYHPDKVPVGSSERVVRDALGHWTPGGYEVTAFYLNEFNYQQPGDG